MRYEMPLVCAIVGQDAPVTCCCLLGVVFLCLGQREPGTSCCGDGIRVAQKHSSVDQAPGNQPRLTISGHL